MLDGQIDMCVVADNCAGKEQQGEQEQARAHVTRGQV